VSPWAGSSRVGSTLSPTAGIVPSWQVASRREEDARVSPPPLDAHRTGGLPCPPHLHERRQHREGLPGEGLPGGLGDRRHRGGGLRIPGRHRQGQGLAPLPVQQHFAGAQPRSAYEGERAALGGPHGVAPWIEQERGAPRGRLCEGGGHLPIDVSPEGSLGIDLLYLST